MSGFVEFNLTGDNTKQTKDHKRMFHFILNLAAWRWKQQWYMWNLICVAFQRSTITQSAWLNTNSFTESAPHSCTTMESNLIMRPSRAEMTVKIQFGNWASNYLAIEAAPLWPAVIQWKCKERPLRARHSPIRHFCSFSHISHSLQPKTGSTNLSKTQPNNDWRKIYQHLPFLLIKLCEDRHGWMWFYSHWVLQTSL